MSSQAEIFATEIPVTLPLLTTVTVAVQVLLLPLSSVTVRVTELSPRSAQVKVFGDTLIEAMPQLSLLPSSISAGSRVAEPLEKRFTMWF